MNLKRYNDWVIAIAGTAAGAVALYGIGRVIFELFPTSNYLKPPPGIAVHAESKAPTAAVPQQLLYCDPILVPGSDVQILPVAARVVGHADRPVSMISAYMMDRTAPPRGAGAVRFNCPSSSDREPMPMNAVVRRSITGGQHLLLPTPAQLSSLFIPNQDCKPTESAIPCDTLLWFIHDTDTNGDGLIDSRDARTLYVSDLAAEHLHRLALAGDQVNMWQWDPRSASLLLLVRHGEGPDAQTDVKVTHPPEWPEPVDLIDPAVRGKLDKAIN
jgi:hypothetical protein